jgi:hypothetical protein
MRRTSSLVAISTLAIVSAGLAAPGAALGQARDSAVSTVPSGTTYTWVGSTQDHDADNHSWTDARNWSPLGVPGDGDSVSIAPPDGTHCVAHVDAVPTATLQDFSLSVAGQCGASVNGGALTIDGTFTWDTGVVNTPMTLAAGSTALVTGLASDNPRKVLEQPLTVQGTLNLTDALVQIAAPTQLTIAPGGTLRSSGSSVFTPTACCVNPAHVVNNGTLNVLGGTLTAQGVQLDQNAALAIAAGAVLQAVANPVTASDGATYTGKGRLQLWTGSKTVLSGQQKLGKGFHLELGNDGSGGDSLGGTATLSGSGRFDWTGGTIMGNLTAGPSVLVHVYGANPGNGRRILSGQDTSGGDPVSSIFVDEGRFVVDGDATFTTSSSARLVIAPDASLSLAPGTHLTSQSCCINPSTILNEGGDLLVPADHDEAGPAILDGIAFIADGGSVDVAQGSELQLTGGPQSGVTAITVTGGGRLTIDDPVSVLGTQTLTGTSSLRLTTRGSIDGIAEITGDGKVDWQGGSLSGEITITTSGLAIGGPNTTTVKPKPGGSEPSEIDVEAPVVFAAAKATQHNVLDLGTSTMTLAGATVVKKYVELNGGTLVNTGSLTFDPGKKGKDYTRVNLHVVNQGTLLLASGELVSDGSYSQAAGTTTLAQGTTATFTFASHPLTVDGGLLTGLGTVAGGLVNNAGTVDPGGATAAPTGTLTVTGPYTQVAGATLHLDLASGGHDVLDVDGAVTVAGTLVAHNLKGYLPNVGDKQRVVTSGGALSWNVGCTQTTGPGSGAGHWLPKPTAAFVDLVWKAGSSGC